MHTTFSFPNRLSESEEPKSWGFSKILLTFLMRFDGHFLPNQQQQKCLPQFKSILDGHLSRHLPASFISISRIPPKNFWSVQSHIPISLLHQILLSQIDRLWNKILWQLTVHFRDPLLIKKTDFTRQVITRTLSKIKKWHSVCEWMLVDST